METVPVSSSFQDGNLINSFNQKGVSSDQAIRNQEANGGCSGLQQQANNKALVFVLCHYADDLYM